MKKTFYALCIMLATFVTAYAQKPKVVTGKLHCTKNSELILPQGEKFSMVDFGNRKSLTPIKVRKSATNEDMVTVTLKAVSKSTPVSGTIFNKDVKEHVYFEGKECSIQVPKGTYDAYVEFNAGSYYYVFKENINATHDIEVEFDQSEAIYPVEFHYFDENNKELFMDVYNGSTLDTPGTADEMIKLSSIIHKDYGNTTFMISYAYMPKGAPEEFYVNKLSDKYFIGQATYIGVNSHYYAYKAVVKDLNQKVYNSKPENLTKLVTDFTPSPEMKNDDNAHLPGVEIAFLTKGYLLGNMRAWCKRSAEDNGKVITFIDCPETSENDDCRMDVTARPVSTDAYKMVSDPDYGDYEEYSFIVAPYAIGNAQQGVKYLVAGTDMDFGFNVPVGEADYRFMPGHPEFSFSSPDGTAHFGNSVPLMSYASMKYVEDSQLYAYDTFRYMGRYSEVRETDFKLANPTQKNTADGTKITITNKNVEVDGIPGKNVTEILFDAQKEDNTAPTFQMLTFKDADGNICDHFKSVQGAKMLVAGGDFTYVDRPEPPYIGYYTCDAPASVKAYYAPHETDTWTDLTLTEDPTKYFMPAFGHFYEADLSGIMSDEKDAWFDLQLEMTDAAGNYQKQLISPAFKINCTATGISQTTGAANNSFVVMGKTVMVAGDNVAKITVRSIDGRTLQNTYNNSVDLSGIGSGVYIVTAVTKNGKVMSTKVAI